MLDDVFHSWILYYDGVHSTLLPTCCTLIRLHATAIISASRLCTYKNWFARPAGRHARSLLDLPLSLRCMQRLLRFRMGCHKLPRDT